MYGICSGGGDQRRALLDFVKRAAGDRKTIEWGPIDVSLDVATMTDGRRGLAIPSGSHWIMQPETRIRALPNGATHYEILDMMDVENIRIEGNGARLVGERDAHRGYAGEWGFGVGARGVRNVHIEGLIAEDCWGDGFYFGAGRRKYCQDIVLRNTKSVRARRNGLSLISARNFLSEDHESVQTGGHAPGWGIDIEPNRPEEHLEDVTFARSRTEASAGIGFGMYLGALEGTPNPVDIRLIDCVDKGSRVGFGVQSARNIDGRIRLIRPVSDRAGEAGIYIRRKALSGPEVRIEEPVVADWNRNDVRPAAARAAITIFAPRNSTGAESLGNIAIIEPTIRLSGRETGASAAIFVMDQRPASPALPSDITIVDPHDLAGLRVWLAAERAVFHDRYGKSMRVLPDADTTLSASSTFVHNVIEVTLPRCYSLALTQPVGIELSFVLRKSRGGGRIAMAPGEKLMHGSDWVNYIESGEEGARLRIRKNDRGSWQVTAEDGIWTSG
jgi:hypothetical protein